MLRLMLNAHSRLAVPHEFKYFTELPDGVPAAQWQAPGLSEAEYRAFIRRFLTRRTYVFEHVGLKRLEDDILSRPERDLRTPYRIAAEAWTRHHGKERWGEKTPQNLFYADVLADMFPEARFVYLVRDPRAVVRSMNAITYFSGDTALNALNWHQAATHGYALLEASVPARQRLTVRYEDVVRDPETHLRRICAFVGEAFEPALLEFHKDSEKYMGPKIRTPSITQSVDAKHIDRWKAALSPREVGVVEAICGPAMASFGYAPSGASPGPLGRLDILAKTLYWKLQQRRQPDRRGHEISYPMFGRTRSRLRRLLGAARPGQEH